MKDSLLKDFYLGFIRIHILHHAAREPVYGQEFQEELERHGYHVSFGTLYPIFHKLEEQGLLCSEQKNVGGKIRKYYTATEVGKSVLSEARAKITELFREVLEE